MGIFSKLLSRGGGKEKIRIGGMEDFMTLIRVYFEAAMAADLGINNLGALPELRTYKMKLHVATVNNKLGVGEKNHCRKMIKEMYSMDDNFFKEIDQSLRKNCRRIKDVQPYLYQFSAFTQDIMMLSGNLMKYKLRLPSIFKKTIYTLTERTVKDIFSKNDYKDASVIKTVMAVRQYDKRLGFSEKWVTDFVYRVVMLAKKEPKPRKEEMGNAKKA